MSAKMKLDEEKERDWSELPAELIHIVGKNLPDLVDFIRFRTVCKQWHSSTPLSGPPHQFPWLLEVTKRSKYWSSLTKEQRFYTVCSGSSLTTEQRYYSVCSGQILMIPFEDGDSKPETWMNQGLCTRYLSFFIDHVGMSFFNPLTKHQFSIPYKGAMRICDPDNPKSLYHDGTGEGGWSSLDPHSNKWIAHKGLFYNSDILEKMYSKSNAESDPADMSNQLDGDELAPHLRNSFLIESPPGILKVFWFHDWHLNSSVELSIFHIYWLDVATADGKPCWVRLVDIGDRTIFLDKEGGFSLTARPSTGFRQGCIYFIDTLEQKCV